MATAAVRISALRKEYPGRGGHQPVVAVDGIDVEIAAGEIVAFLGPNGADKTTTLDIALGLVPPTAGTVEVLGTTPRRAVVAGKVSAVLQTGGLLRDLSVGETVRAVAASVEERYELRRVEPGTFFITPHYDGYPGFLVRLSQVDLNRTAPSAAMSAH